MRRNSEWKLMMTCSALALASLVTGARAQDATDSAQANDSNALEVITVTAERVSASLQDVPISVTALSASDLANKQVLNTLDLVRQVPNLSGSNNVGLGTATSFFLRGVGQTESIATSDPAVGTYVDGVYIARQIANNALLYDIDRIEVLRGPQGTLYGRNTSGGAVKIITKKPSPVAGGHVNARYEFNYNRYEVDATLNEPLTDTLYSQISAVSMKQSDGFIKNVATGQKIWAPETSGARAQLRWVPSADADITASVEWVKDQGEEVVGSDPNDRAALHQDLYTVSSGLANQFAKATSKAFTMNALFNFNDVKLESITGIRDLDQSFFVDDSDKAPIPFYSVPHASNHKQYSQEFTLSGKASAVDWLAGVFYMKEKNHSFIGDQLYLFGGAVAANFMRDLRNDADSYAGFTQLTWHATEALALTAGGRYSRDKKTVDVSQFLVLPSGAPGTTPDYAPSAYPGARGPLLLVFNTATVVGLGTDVNPTYSQFTPKLGVDYKIAPDVLAFVSWTKGFKSGGWNARVTDAADFVNVKPEKVRSTELGVKSEWFDHAVRANVTLYRAEYTDFIVPAINPATGGFVTVNAAAMRSQGVEAELAWKINRMIRLFANVGTIDAKYTELSPNVQSAISDSVGRSPKFSGSIGYDVYIPLSRGAIISTLWFSHQDSFSGGAGAAGRFPATDLTDLTLGYEAQGGAWQVVASCKNCSNQHYFHSALDFGALGFATQYQGIPRQYFLNFRYNFGASN